ncbi:acyl-CoA carboxylase subunit beta [Pedococcus bigeumensis]
MDVDSRPRLTRRDQRLVQCLTVERFAHAGKARLADMAQTTDSVADPLSVGGTDVPDPESGIDIHSTAGKLADLKRRVAEVAHAGSERAIEKQHARGKKTARERLEMLLDEGSFIEMDKYARHRSVAFGQEANRPYGDGVVTGYGTVDGRTVAVFAQDFTVFGGSLGEVFGEKICKVMDFAMKVGCPVVGLNDSGGARIQEGVVSLGLYGEIFRRNVHASGVIPQISLIMGPCAGGAVYSPAVTDFTVMVDQTSHMFITGPEVIKTVTGEDVSFEDLGGARAHNTKSGVAHYMGTDEEDAIEYVKELLSYLPSNNLEEPPSFAEDGELPSLEVTDEDRELDTLIPDSANQPYDMKVVIEHVLDDGEFLEVQPLFAPNILVGYGRIEGRSVGVVANQPMQFAGTLDIDASEKAARFVRTCDAFNIPVLTFVDVPGFLPGTDQEWDGIIRRGAKLIYAYAEATVPLVTVITRKAYGGAYDVMGSKHLGADINLAWPTAQIAVMGAQGAVNILYRKQLAAAAEAGENVDEARARFIAEYEDTLANPYIAAERGYIDTVITPSNTRMNVTRALRALRTKRETLPPKKHGNIPL